MPASDVGPPVAASPFLPESVRSALSLACLVAAWLLVAFDSPLAPAGVLDQSLGAFFLTAMIVFLGWCFLVQPLLLQRTETIFHRPALAPLVGAALGAMYVSALASLATRFFWLPYVLLLAIDWLVFVAPAAGGRGRDFPPGTALLAVRTVAAVVTSAAIAFACWSPEFEGMVNLIGRAAFIGGMGWGATVWLARSRFLARLARRPGVLSFALFALSIGVVFGIAVILAEPGT